MKFKPLARFNTYDTKITNNTYETDGSFRIPEDDFGNPLILPPEALKNTVVNFDNLLTQKMRASGRVPCKGQVALYNKRGKIVAMGRLRDLNEKSSGFEIKGKNLKIHDILYMQFVDLEPLVLTHVKVVLKRIQLAGRRARVGVEFVDATPVFLEKLKKFLQEKRRHMVGFGEIENI